MGRRPSSAELVVLVFACLVIACGSGNTERDDYIREVLQERATHQSAASREEILRGLNQAERSAGVDAYLLLAVMEEESHFRPRATSRRGALGLMQVLPATGRDVSKRNGIPWRGDDTLFDPLLNMLVGATYLAELQERFGSWDLALTAYNEGPTRARAAAKRGKKPSSRYASRVLKRFEALSAAAPATSRGS